MSELNIPEHWAESSLGGVIRNLSQGVNTTTEKVKYSDEGVLVLQANNIDVMKINNVKSRYISEEVYERIGTRYQPLPGDILYTNIGTIGNAVHFKQEAKCAIAWNVLRIQPTPDGINGDYLALFLSSFLGRRQADRLSSKSTMTFISGENMKKISLPIPPKGEQERIVQKIEAYFQKIDETEKALNEVEVLLTKYRESLLAKAFRGELIPQDPKDEPASKLLERIRAERAKNSNGKKVQEIAPISEDEKPFDLPAGWEWVRLGEIIIIESGGTPKELPVESDGTYIDFIKVGDMNESTDGKVIDKVQISLSAITVKNLRIKSLPAGTIIFPKRGGAILTNKKRMLVKEAACDTNIMGIICPSELKEYFWWWFQSIHLATLHTGSTIPQINNGDINPLMFPLPPLSYQSKIINCLESEIKKCDEIKATVDHEMALIHILKSSILKNAFQGLLVPRILSEGTGFQLLEKITQRKGDPLEEIEKKSPTNKIKNAAKKKATK